MLSLSSFCRETDSCRYFTHYGHDKTCLALGNCVNFSSGSCQDCVSGNENCTLAAGGEKNIRSFRSKFNLFEI